jgi:hypothetical protein
MKRFSFVALTILPPCPLAHASNPSTYIYTKMEGTGGAFGEAAGRIISRPRTLFVYRRRGRRVGRV